MLLRLNLLLLILSFSVSLRALVLPCYHEQHYEVCTFLNRYFNELLEWNEPGVTVHQKMHADKFIVLSGDIYDVGKIDSTYTCSILRYDNKAYEVTWEKDANIVLRVLFPIQYELLLGMSKDDIELSLDSLIFSAADVDNDEEMIYSLDSVASDIYSVNGVEYYASIKALSSATYVHRDSLGVMNYVEDARYLDYTLSNLFQHKLGKNYLIQVSQNIYGFQKKNYNISLYQWINYCRMANLKSYVAIEEETDDMLKVFVIAENKTLNYNHVLSVYVPKDFLVKTNVIFYATVNAFIPTHNVLNLYEPYKSKPKKNIVWED